MGILFRTAQDEVPHCLSVCCCRCCPCSSVRRLRISLCLWRLWSCLWRLWSYLWTPSCPHRCQGCRCRRACRSCCQDSCSPCRLCQRCLSLCRLPICHLCQPCWIPICPPCCCLWCLCSLCFLWTLCLWSLWPWIRIWTQIRTQCLLWWIPPCLWIRTLRIRIWPLRSRRQTKGTILD